LITIVGTVIVMPGSVIAMARKGDRDGPEGFPQGAVTLDITVGKLFLSFELRERQLANQEIVHAKNQRSPPPPLRAGAGAAGLIQPPRRGG
jgi:hypothetical protein